MAKGPQQGDRYGDWYLESRAKPIDGKRFWNVTNTQTDETRVVAQTDLKKLDSGDCPADDNCVITEEGKHVLPNSAEITANVLVGKFKDDPFNLPDGVLPEDDSEFPFEVSFIEPALSVEEFASVVGLNPFEQIPGQSSIDDFYDDDESLEVIQEVLDRPADGVTESPWIAQDTELRKQIAVAMNLAADLKDCLDGVLKASLNR